MPTWIIQYKKSYAASSECFSLIVLFILSILPLVLICGSAKSRGYLYPASPRFTTSLHKVNLGLFRVLYSAFYSFSYTPTYDPKIRTHTLSVYVNTYTIVCLRVRNAALRIRNILTCSWSRWQFEHSIP